jgi:hypothetical protein
LIKLLLGRLLPAGLTIGLLTSAISPIQPALKAFGIAADALAGDANAGGVDLPESEDLAVPVPGTIPNPEGFFSKLFGKKSEKTDNARREIAGLVDQLKERADARAAENTKKMAGGKKTAKGKTKAKDKAPAEAPQPEKAPGTPPAPVDSPGN